MSRNGSGVYSPPGADFPAVSGTVIESAKYNNVVNDVGTALTLSVAADGQTTITGDQPMSGYKHTGVGNGSVRTDYAAMGQVQDGKLNWVDGGGTADAITAIYSPTITALVDGQLCCVRATAANATTTPTFAPNGLTARTIVKNGGVALVAGDIVGDGHELVLRYDLANTRWELLNPGAYQPLDAQLTTLAGITAQQATDLAALSTFIGTLLDDADAATARTTLGIESSVQIQPVGASVAANALTLTLGPTTLDFRSTTLTSGAVNTRTVAAQISLVISSGSTLGTVNATEARLAILAIDNAGTVELAVSNLSGGVNLDETTLISTTAEGGAGAADSANVIYSTTARASVPFRVVGFVDITEATAGTWVTAPTLVQGAGGNAATSMMSLGYGQSRQDLTASRALSSTYYNTTGKPIEIRVAVTAAGAGQTNLTTTLNGVAGGADIFYQNAAGFIFSNSFIVLPGESYSVSVAGSSGTPTLSKWTEIR